MKRAVLPFVCLVSGCDELGYPQESAAECGVSEEVLRKAKAAVRDLEPYSTAKVGTCEISVDDARTVRVLTKAEAEKIDRGLRKAPEQ